MVDNVYMVAADEAKPSDTTRSRLVAAGVELLESDGLAALGVRAIARSAGVSHGAPRRYFPTHAQLLAAVARSGLDDLGTEIAPVLRDRSTPPRDRLVSAANAYVGFARRRRAMFELMFRHDILDGAGGDLRSLSVPMIAELHSVVAEFVGDHHSWTATVRFWMSIHGLAVLVANRALEPMAAVVEIDVEALVIGAVDAIA
ncbi:putative TetR family transcriptional regulator [Gordonia polyisoprenivorans NBRC 16320 = JCM 10675]|uniref:TetR/AcrR family transcriptional regulator n=1 Tax=Gordonia polyisoprenivorans TaxID=84595 RepID=A0A846WQD7_9ACTN|nr:TetR/AcrR family transcriptional regulator [Gordonia polyisoprenivorans]NKY03775.1 TetR/AcrR family transcriptional regulator [Gordonia polyisoprenivorans]OZC31261.1 TetR/AcrR family transcriptional regulator [Gordonia polyisoprenivorans]WCB35788.1 TetR/AcrR family transcriptional regulator [Gordonia polyisoprenivorans]GAB21107.1 putative TetR family transcriptional regulator [Gordonia polyisoprenivorans NBRC 16320 = JCM 10675]